MKILLPALVAGTMLAAAPAVAQDSADWTGPYVGGHGGYGWVADDADETLVFDTNQDGSFNDTVNTAAGANAFSPGFCAGSAITNAPSGGCEKDEGSVTFGAQAGYDVQMGDSFVVGLVADYTHGSLRDYVTGYSTTPASYTVQRELKHQAGLRARAGFALNNTLIYGTGGLAYGRIQNSFATTNGANSFTGNGNEDAWGYSLGGGLEQRINPSLSIGVQYLYTSLDAGDNTVRVGQGTALANNPFLLVNSSGTDLKTSNDKFETHGVSAVMNFRF